jgi:hypothetical protein
MSDFTSQYGTNLAATLTMAFIAGVVWCVKNKCKHSACQFHNSWFQCSADDKSTLRSQPKVKVKEAEIEIPQPGAAIIEV